MDSILAPERAYVGASPSEIQALVMSVVRLLDTAKLEIDSNRAAAKASILRASMLLRVEINRQAPIDSAPSGGPLLAWQSGRVREYMDEHLGGRILVSDLSKIAQRSPAHFTRAFKLRSGGHPMRISCSVELRLQFT